MISRLFLSFALVLIAAAPVVMAAPPDPAKASVVESAAPEEASALDFASRHHPELAELLKQLRSMDAKAFQDAVQEIAKVQTKLERLEGKQPEQFQLQLDLWKVDSRIRLMVAKATGADQAAERAALKELLLERQALNRKSFELEQNRLEARLQQVAKSLKRLDSQSDSLVEKEAARLLDERGAKRKTSARKSRAQSRGPAQKSARDNPSVPSDQAGAAAHE